jgi:hypothetical protein
MIVVISKLYFKNELTDDERVMKFGNLNVVYCKQYETRLESD